MNFIKVLLILSLLNGCTLSKSYANIFPIESFVKVNVKTSILMCHEDKDTKTSKCLKEEFYSVGSGSVIGFDKKHSYILTAAHVCVTEVDGIKHDNFLTKTEFYIENRHGKNFGSIIHAIHTEFTKGNRDADLCLLKTLVPTKMPMIRLSKTEPSLGEMLYNVAAPGGFFIPPTVPMFSGHYSGRINEWHSLITIPAIGGSSGSPVVNRQGKLVGMIFAANLQLHHLSISINQDIIKKFLIDNLYSRQPPF